MTISRKIHYPLFVILTSVWWAWTILVDMFIVRAIFSTVDDFFTAGNLGMIIFSQLNNLELIVGSLMIIVLAFESKYNKKVLWVFVLSLLCWVIAIFYISYLTPKLTELSQLWKQSDLQGITSAGLIKDIQQEHQFFHKIYIGTDSLKLLILTFLIIFSTWKREKWN